MFMKIIFVVYAIFISNFALGSDFALLSAKTLEQLPNYLNSELVTDQDVLKIKEDIVSAFPTLGPIENLILTLDPNDNFPWMDVLIEQSAKFGRCEKSIRFRKDLYSLGALLSDVPPEYARLVCPKSK